MKVGVASQNLKTITGHAGRTRRFRVFGRDSDGSMVEEETIELSKEMTLHNHHGGDHPVAALDAMVVGSCGPGFLRRMAAMKIAVFPTSETSPEVAAQAVFNGEALPAAAPHTHTKSHGKAGGGEGKQHHHHGDHAHGDHESCGCGGHDHEHGHGHGDGGGCGGGGCHH